MKTEMKFIACDITEEDIKERFDNYMIRKELSINSEMSKVRYGIDLKSEDKINLNGLSLEYKDNLIKDIEVALEHNYILIEDSVIYVNKLHAYQFSGLVINLDLIYIDVTSRILLKLDFLCNMKVNALSNEEYKIKAWELDKEIGKSFNKKESIIREKEDIMNTVLVDYAGTYIEKSEDIFKENFNIHDFEKPFHQKLKNNLYSKKQTGKLNFKKRKPKRNRKR